MHHHSCNTCITIAQLNKQVYIYKNNNKKKDIKGLSTDFGF